MAPHPLIRTPVISVLAVSATFALFVLMHSLILSDFTGERSITQAVQFDFVRLEKQELSPTKRKIPKKLKPPAKPEVPKTSPAQSELLKPGALGFSAATPFAMNLSQAGGMGGLSATRDPVPILRVAPLYPSRATRRGIEGWVEVMFAITASGATRDIEVVREDPPGVFGRAATKAVRKWKYKPQIIDGVVQERPGVRVILKFELED